MQSLDDYRAIAARHLAVDPDDRMARAMVELVAEVARLHAVIEHRARIDADDMRQIQDFVARVLIERDTARAALAHYRHCPHAIPDCYCCKVARKALGDVG